ncbi:MAG: hypothetical protein ACJ780_13660 [Solirubrobacteraceae bacterium]
MKIEGWWDRGSGRWSATRAFAADADRSAVGSRRLTGLLEAMNSAGHPLRVKQDRRTTLMIPGVATEMTAGQR